MDIMELGAIGELVGGVAVIASLIFVGLQVRQNTKMEGAASHRAILEEVSRYHQPVLQIPEVVQGGFTNFESLSHRDKLAFAGFMQPHVTWFESVMHLHRKGLLDPVIYRAARDYVLAMILSPGGTQWWAMAKELYDPRVRGGLDDAITAKVDLPRPITTIAPFYATEAEA